MLIRSIVLTCLLLVALFCRSALGATATGVVAACPPGEPPKTQTLKGLVTVHIVCDHILVEIPEEALGQDFLFNTEFAALSTGTDFVAPGSVVDNRVVRFTKRGSKLYLEDVHYELWAPKQSNIQRGVEAASLNTVLRTFDVIREGAKGASVIDVTSILVGDVPAGFALDLMRHFHMRSVDPKRSYIDTVKASPGSIDIRFYQTWEADPAELRKPVADGDEERRATLGFVFHTSVLLLPEKPMRGRYADERVGYFTVPFDDYGTDAHGKVSRGFIQRYRLEKKDPKAEVSDPVKPIVFYLSHEVPDKWRPYIKRGIEDWQQVFVKAGFSNAIFARDAPTEKEDPDWDPEDVRYNVVRWTPSGRQNAMGPAVIDPRSGEVISSHAIFWHDVLRLAETWYFVQVSPMDPRGQKLPLPDDITGELLRYIVGHEIGHALGLRHNFKAHSAYSIAQLRNSAWTKQWGTAASIMDYARLNYVAQPGDGAFLLPRFGPYDYFAIEWGYRQYMNTAVEDGQKVTQPMSGDDEWVSLDTFAAQQVTNPMIRFGGEDDSAALDPGVGTNVIGGDPIEAAALGLKNIDRVAGFLIPGATQLGGSYGRMREMYQALVQQRYRELGAVAKLVGGVEETRYQAGRGGAPFQPIPPERQHAAVTFLIQQGFTKPAALLNRDLVLRLYPWGAADALQGSNVQLLRRLIDVGVFQRMAEAQAIDPTVEGYSGLDMLFDLNDGLFQELKSTRPRVDLYRRDLQRNYVVLLLVASGAISDSQSSSTSIDVRQLDSSGVLALEARHLSSERMAASPLADVAQQTRRDGRPSEFRSALRAGVADLYAKIEAALKRVKDPATAAHLKELRSELAKL